MDDMADTSVFVLNLDEKIAGDTFFNYPKACFVNVGAGIDCTVLELAQKIHNIIGFTGSTIFDKSKPDGTPRKLLDISKLSLLGWSPKIGLKDGIEQTYHWFLQQVCEK